MRNDLNFDKKCIIENIFWDSVFQLPKIKPAFTINELITDYINAFKLVENKADLAAFCDLSKTLEDVKNKNKLLSDKYNQCISEILDAKSKEIAIKGEKADLLLKIADLEAKNKELKRQITLMELTKL